MRDGRIEYLIRLVEKSDIAELEITEGWGTRIRISKYAKGGPVVQHVAAATAPAAPPAQAAAEPPAMPSEAAADVNLVKVVAPMVGTFYRASSPDAPPFVEVGGLVQPGQTLCIIEAMKLMNEVKADQDGIVRRIHVENAQPVEYGELLFELEPVNGRPPGL